MKIIETGKFWIIEYQGRSYRREDRGHNYSTTWGDLGSGKLYQHFDDKFKELENEFIKLTETKTKE